MILGTYMKLPRKPSEVMNELANPRPDSPCAVLAAGAGDATRACVASGSLDPTNKCPIYCIKTHAIEHHLIRDRCSEVVLSCSVSSLSISR